MTELDRLERIMERRWLDMVNSPHGSHAEIRAYEVYIQALEDYLAAKRMREREKEATER